jgi:hypothetical protein
MRRIAAVASSLAFAAVLSACAGKAKPASPGLAGDIAFDAAGTTAVRVPLEWPEYDVPKADGPVTYEARVWQARDGLPGEESARADGIRGNEASLAVRLPKGDYVWSVRAHFVRGGWPCVSGWYFVGRAPDDRLLPRRGFAPLSVP